MKKSITLLLLLLLTSSRAHSNPTLENSVWGRAAASAGVNVATLYSIAVQESGMRWRDGTFRPWPWTLNVNAGKNGIKAGPRRYVSKEAAAQALKEMLGKGVTNVDIGLMQVNYYWHGHKVSSPYALLDPQTNIRVAADYLKALNKHNVNQAVADYHAPSNPARGKTYVQHVKHYEKIIHEKLK